MKKITTSLIIAILLSGLSVFPTSHISHKAIAISQPASSYVRINFNVNSKTETKPISSVKNILIANNIKPIRIWVLINNNITAMFTYQEGWNIRTFDKNIRNDILKNYAVRFENDSEFLKKHPKNRILSSSYEKLLEQDKRILKNFSDLSFEIKVLAVDVSLPCMTDNLNSFGVNFKISEIPYSEIIPSPQMQWNINRSNNENGNKMGLSNTPLKDPPPPSDSQWLPDYVATDVRTLRDSEQTRYINQQTEWYTGARLYYFRYGYEYNNKHYDTAYEQDTIFYKENKKCYVDTPPHFFSPVKKWYSNLPSPYLDTRIDDSGGYINLTIGSSEGKNLKVSTLYYYSMYVNKGDTESGYELKTYEEPCYFKYKSNDVAPRYERFGLKSHIECNRAYIPVSYSWMH